MQVFTRLGEFLTWRRNHLRMSREDVSSRAKNEGYKISPSYIAKLEAGVSADTGKEPKPTIDKLSALASALNVPTMVMIQISNPKNRAKLTIQKETEKDIQNSFQEYLKEVDYAFKMEHMGPGKVRYYAMTEDNVEFFNDINGVYSEWEKNKKEHPRYSRIEQALEERHAQLMAQLEVATTPEEIRLIADELKKLAKEMGYNTEELDQRHKRGGYTLTQVLEATDGGGMIKLPVYGLASCGSPTYIEDHPEEYQAWPAIMAKDADGILVVRGQSMEGVGYRDGDLIFVRRIDGAQPNSGEKVIASIDGDYTCKIYRHDEMGDYLEAAYANDKTWRIAIRPGVSLVAIVTWHASRESR